MPHTKDGQSCPLPLLPRVRLGGKEIIMHPPETGIGAARGETATFQLVRISKTLRSLRTTRLLTGLKPRQIVLRLASTGDSVMFRGKGQARNEDSTTMRRGKSYRF